jgi:hypothetical protein
MTGSEQNPFGDYVPEPSTSSTPPPKLEPSTSATPPPKSEELFEEVEGEKIYGLAKPKRVIIRGRIAADSGR